MSRYYRDPITGNEIPIAGMPTRAEIIEVAESSDVDTADNTTTFTSSDTTDADANAWTSVTRLLSGENHKSIFAKVSQMFKNIRYLYKILGTTDISSIGDGTVTGGLDTLNNVLSGNVLWQGDTNYISPYTINLSDSYQNYKKLLFFLIVDKYSGRPIIREVSCEQIDYLRTGNAGSISMCWGYFDINDYFDIQKTSTTTSLVVNSVLTKCVKVIGLKHY